MILSIHKLLVAGSKADFGALLEFFSALGLQPADSWSGRRSSGAHLHAPEAGVEVGVGEGFPQADLVLQCDSADTMYELVEHRGLSIVSHIADTAWGARMFEVELPAHAGRLAVFSYIDAQGGPKISEGKLEARGLEFAIVVSRFNSFITERLLAGAQDALRRSGAKRDSIHVVRVPGAFEIPAAARTLSESGRYDAIVCLGCLLRGDTLHYDVIANEVARGIGQSAQESGVPHAFGVLTCDTLEQAIDRAGLKAGNKGFEAALAAVEMARVKQELVAQPAEAKSRSAAARPARAENAKARRASATKKSGRKR